VHRDDTSKAVGEIGVVRMKPQERNDRPVEVLDVLGLGLVINPATKIVRQD